MAGFGGLSDEELNAAYAKMGSDPGRVGVQPPATLPPAPRVRTTAAPGQVLLDDSEEAQFQHDLQFGDGYRQWREQFTTKHGGPPVLDDPDYDYRAAWKAGIRPAPYKHDGGAYHWASSAEGKMLKGENHPTAWMEHFMEATGKDPNDLGIKSKEEGEAYLAKTGTSSPEKALTKPGTYRAATPEQTEAAPVDDMSIEAAKGGPRKAIAQYQGEQLADSNERIGLIGERGSNDSRAYADRAGIRGRQGEQAQANIDDARSRVDEKRSHEDRYRQEADRVYEEMKAHAQPPPQSTISKVLGIVGAVASMKGSSQGLGQGATMLSSMLGSDSSRWAAEQEANSRLYQSALGMVGSDRQGEQNDLEVAQKMTALEAHEINAALEQVSEMGLSKNATNAAKELQLKFGQEVRQGLIGMEQAKAGAAAKMNANAQDDALWRMPLPALQQLADQGGLSEKGHAVLAQKIKNEGGRVDVAGKGLGMQKTQAEIEKLRADGKDAGRRLTEGEAKQDAIVAGAKNAYKRLLGTVQSGEEVNRGATKETWLPDLFRGETTLSQRADLKNLAMSVLRVESGSAISDQEIEAKYEALPINSGDPEIRAQGVQDLLASYRALDRQGRLADTAEAHSPGPASDPRVRSGFASAPSAASRGIARDESGNIGLPQIAEMSDDELRAKLLTGQIDPSMLVRR